MCKVGFLDSTTLDRGYLLFNTHGKLISRHRLNHYIAIVVSHKPTAKDNRINKNLFLRFCLYNNIHELHLGRQQAGAEPCQPQDSFCYN